MRHRLTFLIPPNTPHPVSPEQFHLTESSLSVSNLHATREDRFTLNFDELPSDIRDFFSKLSERNVEMVFRWTAGRSYESVEPFVARAPSGLNVILKGEQVELIAGEGSGEGKEVCEVLKKVFPSENVIDGCESVGKSFVPLPGNQYHFYSPMQETGLEKLAKYILDKVKPTITCADESTVSCLPEHLQRLHNLYHDSLAYIDITFQPATRNLAILLLLPHSTLPSSPEQSPVLWTTVITKYPTHKSTNTNTNHRLEIGIFDPRPAHNSNANDISLGGVVTELGDSTELEPVLISFPSKHHHHFSSSLLSTNTNTNAYYKAGFKKPTGLHPKYHLSITFPRNNPLLEDEECKLYAYFTLPKHLFVDKYQLADAKLLESLNLRRLVALHGEADLEAPVWTQARWGSIVVFELMGPRVAREIALEDDSGDPRSADKKVEQGKENGEGVNKKVVVKMDVEIPFHVRYLPPSRGKIYENVAMPWPVVFWGCGGQKLNTLQKSPFERALLGWEFAFDSPSASEPEDTVYHFISPSPSQQLSSQLYSQLSIPTLNQSTSHIVKAGTIAAVLLGFMYIVGKILLGPSWFGGVGAKNVKRGEGKGEGEREKKEQ